MGMCGIFLTPEPEISSVVCLERGHWIPNTRIIGEEVCYCAFYGLMLCHLSESLKLLSNILCLPQVDCTEESVLIGDRTYVTQYLRKPLSRRLQPNKECLEAIISTKGDKIWEPLWCYYEVMFMAFFILLNIFLSQRIHMCLVWISFQPAVLHLCALFNNALEQPSYITTVFLSATFLCGADVQVLNCPWTLCQWLYTVIWDEGSMLGARAI